MSIRKRGEFWHYDFTLDDGVRRRGPTRQRSKAAALKIEARERERAALGETSQPEVWTLERAARAWFSARVEGQQKSVKDTAFRLKRTLELLGSHTLVTDVDDLMMEAAVQMLRLTPTRWGKVRKNGSVNRDLIDSTTRPLLLYCRRRLRIKGMIEIDWTKVRLREPKERVRDFTPDEMGAWETALPVWHRPLRDFLGRYGMRLSEAFFPLSAVNTETWEITVRGPRRKNGRPHVIPLLDDDARDIAARMGRAQQAELDTVWFREMRSGELRPITPQGFQSASRAALLRAEITDARPAHDLRHHAGTAAMRAVGNLKVVQQLLGHQNIASTARYAHVNTDDLRRALRHAHGTIDEDDKNTSTKTA